MLVEEEEEEGATAALAAEGTSDDDDDDLEAISTEDRGNGGSGIDDHSVELDIATLLCHSFCCCCC